METVVDHCNGHVLKYMPICSVLALSKTSKKLNSFVKGQGYVWEREVPHGMSSGLSARDTIQSIGRASNVLHGRIVPNVHIATDRVVHIAEFNGRFYVITQSLCVFVSSDRECSQFYWYASGVSDNAYVTDISSCGKDLFASSTVGMRWLELGHTNKNWRAWSHVILPFPIVKISAEVPGHAYVVLNTGVVGYYVYSGMGTDREQTHFTIRSVHSIATHIVSMPDPDRCVVGCTERFVVVIGMVNHSETFSTYPDADGGDSIESMQLIKPSGEVAILFKNFHLCILNTDSATIRRVGLVPFAQQLPVCMSSHGNNIHVFPHCQQFTYSDKRGSLEMTNALHGRIITSCFISNDYTMALVACSDSEIFAIPLI